MTMTGLKRHFCFQGVALAIATAGFIAPVLAANLTGDEVQSAVETWVRHVTADARSDAVIELLEPHRVDGRTVGYIAHLGGGGYCLCGADDLLLPVYLYRPFGTYDPSNPSYRYILSRVAHRLRTLEESIASNSPELDQYERELSDRADYWSDLIVGRVPEPNPEQGGRTAPTIMTLHVDAYWHQRSPFNDQCPVLTDHTDEHTKVGCVATTAAQIMYYWKWPNTGTGSNSVAYNRHYRTDWDHEPLTTDPVIDVSGFWADRLDWTADAGGRLYVSAVWDNSVYLKARTKCNDGVDCDDPDYHAALQTLWFRMLLDSTVWDANFGAATYDWNDMNDVHIDGDGVDDSEVAKLCYQAGIAVGMQYGYFTSVAGMSRDGIVAHFRYDSDAVTVTRDVDTMVDELQWLRPLEMAGVDAGEEIGHSWTIAGYNTTTSPWQFLMNIGWGGGSTEWFSVDEVFPDDQMNTIRIAPASAVRFVGASTLGDGTPASPYRDIEEAVQEASDNATSIFKAGGVNTISGGFLEIARPMTLKGYHVTVEVPS